MLVERKEHKEADDSIGYIESVFESDNVLKTTYFPLMQRLYIAFSRGDTYSYGNITQELYEEFENAESQGKFFHKNINNRSKYPVRREFTLYPNEVQGLKQIVEENKQEKEEEDDENS
ncbi:MAG: KTSC domain-containing protein [Dehalococcoidia bacterium]|jgi:hypothetical protein